MFPAFLTTICFSLSAISGSRCARVFGGLEANFYRLVIAFLLLTSYCWVVGSRVTGEAAWAFVISGIVGVGLGDMLFFQALPRIGARLTVLLIQCLSVPFAAIVEWWWLGHPLSLSQLGSITLVIGGLILALAPGKCSPGAGVKWGVVVAVIAAIGNGSGAVLSRKAYAVAASSGQSVDGPTGAYLRVLGGLAVAGLVVAFARGPKVFRSFTGSGLTLQAEYKKRWKSVWPWVIVTSLAGQTIGVTCFQWALKTQPTGVVLPIVALTPLVTIPFAHYLEGERPARRSLAGGVVAVLGVIALLKFT